MFITGVPLRSTPACNLTSLRDYVWATVLCRGDAPTEFYMEDALFTGVETPACTVSPLRGSSKETLKRREGIGPLPSF